MNQILLKDLSDNWNTIPPVPSEKIKEVNCHKFVLYIIGKISWDEMISDSNAQKQAGLDFTFEEKAKEISDLAFVFIQSWEDLTMLVEKSCEENKYYAGQILDSKTGELAHSFVLQRKEGKLICFDKQGFKYPFNVYELRNIFDFVNKDGEKSYREQRWRFVPFKFS